MNNDALIIFAKNPEKGKVKTRIAQTEGDDVALQVYKHLLKYTRDVTSAYPVRKYAYGAEKELEYDFWGDSFELRKQEGDDLGERMQNAFVDQLGQHEKVILIGSDCFQINATILNEAFEALDKDEVVIGPSEDGGYYLLGMKKMHESLFKDKSWSTEFLFQETISEINQKELKFHILPNLRDVDHWEDVPTEIREKL